MPAISTKPNTLDAAQEQHRTITPTLFPNRRKS